MLGSHWLTCTFIFSSYTFTQTCILSKIAGPTNFDWLGLCFPIRGWATARRPATLTFITSHNNVRIILYHIAVKSAMGKCFWHRWSLLEICLLYCCQRIVQDQVAKNNLIFELELLSHYIFFKLKPSSHYFSYSFRDHITCFSKPVCKSYGSEDPNMKLCVFIAIETHKNIPSSKVYQSKYTKFHVWFSKAIALAQWLCKACCVLPEWITELVWTRL